MNQTGATETIDSESILIRDEFYCGRRFRSALHHAIWFTEQDELKLYRIEGGLQCVLRGSQIDAVMETKPEADLDADLATDSQVADILAMPIRSAAADDSIRRAA